MAIQLLGADGSSVAAVDPTFQAQRMTIRPVQVASYSAIGAQSGALTGLAAGAPVFAFRNSTTTNSIMVRRVGIGFVLTTAFTTAQITDFSMIFARSWTASDTGGTAIGVSGGNFGKVRTSLANISSVDCRIGTTAALTAGTRTLDATPLAQTGGWAGALGGGLSPVPDNLLSQSSGDYPVILAPNEGVVITALTAFGATGAGRLYVNCEFAEVVSY